VPLILSAGKNAELLQLRTSVLQATGCHVVVAGSTAEVKKILLAATVDVAVLCHTFTEDEAREIAAAVKSANMKSCVCVLFRRMLPANTPLFDLRLDAAEGPEALVQSVTQLLASET
jgi:hypothetical protein